MVKKDPSNEQQLLFDKFLSYNWTADFQQIFKIALFFYVFLYRCLFSLRLGLSHTFRTIIVFKSVFGGLKVISKFTVFISILPQKCSEIVRIMLNHNLLVLKDVTIKINRLFQITRYFLSGFSLLLKNCSLKIVVFVESLKNFNWVYDGKYYAGNSWAYEALILIVHCLKTGRRSLHLSTSRFSTIQNVTMNDEQYFLYERRWTETCLNVVEEPL